MLKNHWFSLLFSIGPARPGIVRRSIHTPRGRPTQQEPFARALGNLNARTRERLPTSSVTATSCNLSPTFPHLHSQQSGPWPSPFICVCLSVYVSVTMWVECLFERLRWCAVGALPPAQWQPLPHPWLCKPGVTVAPKRRFGSFAAPKAGLASLAALA